MPTTDAGPVLDEMASQVAQQPEMLAMHIANHLATANAATGCANPTNA